MGKKKPWLLFHIHTKKVYSSKFVEHCVRRLCVESVQSSSRYKLLSLYPSMMTLKELSIQYLSRRNSKHQQTNKQTKNRVQNLCYDACRLQTVYTVYYIIECESIYARPHHICCLWSHLPVGRWKRDFLVSVIEFTL